MVKDATRKKTRIGSAEPQTLRGTDADVLQRRAASPDSSVWVGASAGSGKTKVLTDRVLRLLLPRLDGGPGTAPHKILCITFTKAAASEMNLRIRRVLSEWAVLPEDGPAEKTLQGELTKLLGRAPVREEITAARRLFAEIADAPGGMRIMTIHSFCASVLGRFPLEAGIAPHFTELEEQEAKGLLSQARDSVLQNALTDKTSPLGNAIHKTAGLVNDEQFLKLIENICGERFQLQQLLAQNFGADGMYTALCAALSIRPGLESADICKAACEDKVFAKSDLKNAAQNTLSAKAQTRSNLAQGVLDWLALDVNARAAKFDDYCRLFLTLEGNPNSKIFTDAFARDNPVESAALLTEATRLIRIIDTMNAAACAALTRDILILGEAILAQYQALKNARGALDFDDLITLTLKLLQQKDMAAWVLYKLDQGLDHILIDEAQDTNPEQWNIALSLAQEFFSGIGARDEERTTFTVGDEKQSIYSFQRASPEKFVKAHDELETLVNNAGKKWDNIPFNFSFRSTASVLSAVDATFTDPEMRQGLGSQDVIHNPKHRSGQAGLVELWPICETIKDGDDDPWEPPVRVIEKQTGAAKLAKLIAQEIDGWRGKEILPSHARTVRPEDILILVRTRNAFVSQLARELKTLDIPISGVDRMILNEQLAVQDMLALAEFALLPSDDLTLATILKSPLIGWDEEKLYTLAAERTGTLWEALNSSAHKEEIKYLEELIALAGSEHPYEFFSSILQRRCPADKISGLRAFKKRLGPDAIDPLDELLNAALEFEHSHVPSLQGFLHWQARESEGIKRQMEEPKGEVRIMTVHGAKGLQAPIVILPDTMRTASRSGADSRLLWPDKSGLSLPLWCPHKDLEFEVFRQARGHIQIRQDEEYRRLLYVAMTRAEDRLYVCAHKGTKTVQAQHWYESVKSGLGRLEGLKTLENGRIRIDNPQVREPDKARTDTHTGLKASDLPPWLYAPTPAEPTPPQPLIPSRPSDSQMPVLSPLSNDSTYRFKRGNLTHKLLEFLPDLPEAARTSAAQAYIARYGRDLPADIGQGIIKETLAILNHPEFAPIFGSGSLAEVPVTGLMADGRVISGQIDRLLITQTTILIVDYKTNRPPPANPKDVPAIYFNQMKAYADTLRAIYPNRAVHCALLWTDGPRLMKLDV